MAGPAGHARSVVFAPSVPIRGAGTITIALMPAIAGLCAAVDRPVRSPRGHPKTIRSRISHRRVRDMCHVLIIEDEPYIAMQIEDVLRAGGARSVTIATTETDAIAAAQARRPDFITSDVRLSDGTGPSAIKAIRAMFAVVPVTFVTAWPQACGDVGRAEVLQKPVTAAALLASFRRALPGC
ncbi:CheY-like chemotaxis protein [Sphingomonas endophytica]|uniref:CheY-like chemotaxis protein n=1 Tax=Sphingomonas endophytica TaxID=869719 RepID=A0ABR6N359_9SPHN|nr:response regulator [Sphingomonas endophytica]MBB5725218.1 CheY-like chemotaxis protein [Sphingomonas endophytica]